MAMKRACTHACALSKRSIFNQQQLAKALASLWLDYYCTFKRCCSCVQTVLPGYSQEAYVSPVWSNPGPIAVHQIIRSRVHTYHT